MTFPTHTLHAVEALAFLGVSLGGIALAESAQKRRGARRPRSTNARSSLRRSGWVSAAAAAGAGAAVVHLLVMPKHFREAVLYGLFFLTTATVQLGWSVLVLLRPARILLWLGAGANGAIFALWLVTRLVAVPLGPSAGTTEPFGAVDLTASGCELTLVVAALAALGPHLRPRRAAPAAAPRRSVAV